MTAVHLGGLSIQMMLREKDMAHSRDRKDVWQMNKVFSLINNMFCSIYLDGSGGEQMRSQYDSSYFT